ncbi:hypothetical protein ACJIZ3_018125 [Penstemon smallii]|uniref:Uncharacterized protein n=1 Tax=Penstemon smallii TaxID=265156 RepID=A0ABD3SYS9_9LAMI
MTGILESILNTNKNDLDRMLGVNLIGAFLGAKHASRVMVPSKRGGILFTASSCTKIGGIASHSIWLLSCISPIGVLTGSDVDAKKERSNGKNLKAEDIAKAALYLASDEAS